MNISMEGTTTIRMRCVVYAAEDAQLDLTPLYDRLVLAVPSYTLLICPSRGCVQNAREG